MPSFRIARRLAIAALLGFGGAALSLPGLAGSPVTVTFPADSPWAQEVGSLTRDDYRHEYSVAVAADKTLQINLVSRNPNIFFKVHKDGQFSPLVDTFKTGAKTWSTSNASAANYTIHVYIDRAAIPPGGEAKYALQIGQYGAQNMQPASTPVTFQAGNPWAQQVGSLDASGSAHDYTLVVPAGNTLQVNLIARESAVHFKVLDQARGSTLFDSGSAGATTWSTPVTTATNFTIRVFADAASLPPGRKVGYALQVGQYPSGDAPTPAAAATIGN